MSLVRSLSVVRLVVFVLGAAYLWLQWDDVPDDYRALGVTVLCAHLVLGVALFVLARTRLIRARRLAYAGVLIDMALITGYVFTFAYEPGQPLRSLFYLVVLEAALLFRTPGGLAECQGICGRPMRGGRHCLAGPQCRPGFWRHRYCCEQCRHAFARSHRSSVRPDPAAAFPD